MTPAGRLVERERPPADAVNAETPVALGAQRSPAGVKGGIAPAAGAQVGWGYKGRVSGAFLGGAGWKAGRACGGGVPSGVPPTRPACLLGADQVYRAPTNAKEGKHDAGILVERSRVVAVTNGILWPPKKP